MKNNYIIKKHEDFNFIINKGKRLKGNILTIYYHPSEDNKKYFGFAVGNKNEWKCSNQKFYKKKIKNVSF